MGNFCTAHSYAEKEDVKGQNEVKLQVEDGLRHCLCGR